MTELRWSEASGRLSGNYWNL